MIHLKSEIPHIGIFGDVNSGKSTLINSLLNQEVSTVSNIKGTTTDSVYKRMELLNVGPIILIDTPGLNDQTILGERRRENTHKSFIECDVVLYVASVDNLDQQKN